MTSWVDRGTFWVWDAPQRSSDWINSRKYRITASRFSVAAGRSTRFSTPGRLALVMSGKLEEEFTVEQRERMDYGTMMEDEARSWYEQNRGVKVIETGLAVPKWDLRLGASTDGEVISSPESLPWKREVISSPESLPWKREVISSPESSLPDSISPESLSSREMAPEPSLQLNSPGCIEIKCPREMYLPLVKRLEEGGPTLNYDHIWTSHFDQMQGTMAVMGKKWCDYVVYCPDDQAVYTERIPFNQVFWEGELYPRLKIFLDKILAPQLSEHQLRLDPPK